MSFLLFGIGCNRTFSTSTQGFFRWTPTLSSSPLKKRHKVDPAVIRQREEKKIKKLTKALRKMEKKPRIVKPVFELEVVFPGIKRDIRLTPEIVEERALLKKKWARWAGRRHINEIRNLDFIMLSQNKALENLRFESEELYREAIQFDEELVPFKFVGPSETPPIPDYTQDGRYNNVTPKFEVKYDDMTQFLRTLTTNKRNRKRKGNSEETED